MTPKRAQKMASDSVPSSLHTNNCESGEPCEACLMVDVIGNAILAAVAEQREADAKICEAPICDGKIDVGNSVVSCCVELARAIRNQEK